MIEEHLNKVRCVDCLDFMKGLPDKSIDLVLTDPPYELEWKDAIPFNDRKDMYHHKESTQQWDRGVEELYEAIFTDFDRIVKYNGSVILFTRAEYITYAVDACKRHGFDNKATICWKKTNPMPQVRKKNYLSSIELVLWVARYSEKGCPFTFNFLTQNEMHNFVEMPLCGGNERQDHPTQKPLALMERFVIIHSNPGDIIFDPFAGSGTTGVAAIKLGRKFLGCDMNAKYADMSNDRLRVELEQNRLF
jgi:DNA modification methylase